MITYQTGKYLTFDRK